MIKSNAIISILHKRCGLYTMLSYINQSDITFSMQYKKIMHYTNLAFQLIHSDIIKFSQSNRREGTMLRCTNLTFKRFNQMSLSQSNIKGKSNMLSYPTERPVTSYRIKIISRRYRSTLKCFLHTRALLFRA